MTLANWAPARSSTLRMSSRLTPYSGSPDRPRRPYLARATRRRTSPVIFTASCTTWNKSTTRAACGSIRWTAEA
jgi:hypothetical protein